MDLRFVYGSISNAHEEMPLEDFELTMELTYRNSSEKQQSVILGRYKSSAVV